MNIDPWSEPTKIMFKSYFVYNLDSLIMSEHGFSFNLPVKLSLPFVWLLFGRIDYVTLYSHVEQNEI